MEAQKKMSTCRPVHSCKDYALFLRCTSLRLRPGSTSCGARQAAAMEMSHIKSTRHMKSSVNPHAGTLRLDLSTQANAHPLVGTA